jgi:hypothetical protein
MITMTHSPFLILVFVLYVLIILMFSGCGESGQQQFSSSFQPPEADVTQPGATQPGATQPGATQTGTIVVKLPGLSRATHTVDNNTVEFTGHNMAGTLVYGPKKEPLAATVTLLQVPRSLTSLTTEFLSKGARHTAAVPIDIVSSPATTAEATAFNPATALGHLYPGYYRKGHVGVNFILSAICINLIHPAPPEKPGLKD